MAVNQTAIIVILVGTLFVVLPLMQTVLIKYDTANRSVPAEKTGKDFGEEDTEISLDDQLGA